MVVFKRTTNKNRAFHVGMRFLHKQARYEYKNLYYRYFKWILWIFLSLYFFSSYLITNSHQTASLPTIKLSPSSKTNFVSRALFESNTTISKESFITISPGLNGIAIYVYDLPSNYNTDWLSNKRCSNHLFASEVAIHKAIMNSDLRTFDPFQADFFFVPVYVSCNFSTVNGFPALGHARELLSSAVEYISTEMQFWNRSNGYDHIFVASHDYGACFHAMEERAIAAGVPEFMKKSIILQTFGVEYRHPCQEVENVLIPPYISPQSIKSTLEMMPLDGKRDIWAFFRGKMEVHPKNVSGRFYSKKVRTVIWEKFNRHKKFYLKRHKFNGYQTEMARSVFCLCPLGWAPWSPRLVESVALGCVPVIIADGIRLPFSTTISWPNISLTVEEKDVGQLADILEHVAVTNLTTIQRNLWSAENRRAMMFNDQIEYGDATWQVLHALSEKIGTRSYQRSKEFTQLSVDA
ncbi:putative glucuronoxylan glucuronosyltransferase irx7 [Ranunculus cassubicifolius]